jgi:hypothetical protein
MSWVLLNMLSIYITFTAQNLHYTQFTSLFFKNICEIFRIDKTQTTAFHPQSDGLVERFNLHFLTALFD